MNNSPTLGSGSDLLPCAAADCMNKSHSCSDMHSTPSTDWEFLTYVAAASPLLAEDARGKKYSAIVDSLGQPAVVTHMPRPAQTPACKPSHSFGRASRRPFANRTIAILPPPPDVDAALVAAQALLDTARRTCDAQTM